MYISGDLSELKSVTLFTVDDSDDDTLSVGEWIAVAIAICAVIVIVVLCILLVAFLYTKKRGLLREYRELAMSCCNAMGAQWYIRASD